MVVKNVFDAALSEEGVSGKLAEVARSIYQQESGGGRNTRTSNAGAMGGMQIIPSTFASVADKGWDINDPLHNARAGIRYLKQLDKQSGGDPVLTAAGYYGGPGGLEKARKGIAVSDPRNPNAPTTLQYGQQVASRLGRQAPVVEAEIPDVALAPAPIQLAQVPAVQSEPQGVVPASPQMPAPEEWAKFQQQMAAKEEQPMELNFGPGATPVMPQYNPVALAPQRIEPNFAAFSRWQRKHA